MDRNSITGLLLIGAVLIIWTRFFAPEPPKKVEVDNQEQTTTEVVDDNTETEIQEEIVTNTELLDIADVDPADSSAVAEMQIRQKIANEKLQEQYGVFYPSVHKADKPLITIENEKLKAWINLHGGTIEKVALKDYKTWEGDSLVLMDDRSDMYIELPYGRNSTVSTGDFDFVTSDQSFSVTGEQTDEIKLRLNTSDPSKYVEYIYALDGNDYEVDFKMNVINLNNEVPLNQDKMHLHWNLIGLSNEKSKSFEDNKSSVFYKYQDEERDYLTETSAFEEEELSAPLDWLAMKQYFFSAVAIPAKGFDNDRSSISCEKLEDPELTKEYNADVAINAEGVNEVTADIKYYFGPNQYKILSTYDNGMERIIDLGWGIFGWMNKWLVIPVFNFLSKFIGSYGVIILLLTVFIKMLLYPLTYRNYLSSAKMKVLKPEIKEVSEKHKDDPMKRQQETMALYRKSGVNPMAGCVPMLIQMPILYAMFNFFPSSIELRQQSFLWANDLSTYDSIFKLPFEIPFYGSHVSLFCLLMAVSTILYTRMNSSQMPEGQPGMPNMKVMMYIFPVMMLFFFNSYPSGLSYYYLLANVISMIQMYVIKNYVIDEQKIRAKIEMNQKTPKKKSKFQQRLEEAAKEQQRRQAQKSRR